MCIDLCLCHKSLRDRRACIEQPGDVEEDTRKETALQVDRPDPPPQESLSPANGELPQIDRDPFHVKELRMWILIIDIGLRNEILRADFDDLLIFQKHDTDLGPKPQAECVSLNVWARHMTRSYRHSRAIIRGGKNSSMATGKYVPQQESSRVSRIKL